MATYYRTPWKHESSSGTSSTSSSRRPGGSSRTGGRPGSYSSSPRSYGGSGSRPPFGGGSSRFGGGSSRGGRSGGSRGGNMGERIDPTRFINKGAPVEDVVVYVPQHQFSDFSLDERLQKNLDAKGYKTPTPIQDQSITSVLEGKDIVGLANTGTGKTGAFLIPLIHRTLVDRNRRVLIMVPTRELAVQIVDEFRAFGRALPLHTALCVGGAGIYPQVSELRRHPAFVIGTPGRLKDLMERRALDVSQFDTVVLDEADRMLDMGFIADMRFILAKMPAKRHTLFFSATLSREIEKLIGEFLTDPVRVSVKTRDTAATIDQDVVRVERGANKFDVLVNMLKDPSFSKVLVFGRTKYGVERLARDLSHGGIRAEAIHGNKTHSNRLKALTLFKRDQVQVLVATDVAARGLDITGVSHVINFDLPNTYDDYVHRIGRTGRAGAVGKALTFI